MAEPRKRALTGIQPSGAPHIGNLLGMIRPALALQQEFDCIYFIADFHALTTTKEPELLASQTLDLAAGWLALGLDAERHILFRQSDVPLVTEFAWYLSCCTGFGFLEKAHAFKDAQAKNRDVNVGVFSYPILMAADILLYDVDVVPVGKDQKQHVEMARDMAGSFNAEYGSVIHLPEPLINERVMLIPGLDGRKMSKSYNNTIEIFSTEKALRKKVLAIVTDSTPLEAPKSLKGTFLGQLFELFAAPAAIEDLEQRLSQGGLGWGHAKQELFEAMNDQVKAAREVYFELRADEGRLRQVLRAGAERAEALARPVLQRVRQAVGIR